jgi:O-antigen ligase
MREPAARDMLAAAISVAGVIEAVYVLCQAAYADPLLPAASLPGKWRAFGTLGNPNWAGEFLAVALLVAWGRLSARPEIPRAGMACVAVIAMALGATFARGAWLGCAIAAGACAALRGFPRVRRFAVAAAVPAVGAAALIAVLRPDTVAFLANAASLRGRLWIWTVSARMIREAPWGGFGLGAFGLHFPRFQAEAFSHPWGSAFLRNASFTPHAHNEFLQLWAEAGILAPLALAALLYFLIARGRAMARDPVALGCWAGLISLSVNLAYASPLYLPASLALFAVLAGTVEAAASTATVRLPARPTRCAAPVLAVILCALALPFAWGHAAGEIAISGAIRALQRRDQTTAAAAVGEAERREPGRMETWTLAGRFHFATGRYDAAAEAFRRAATLGYDPQVFASRSAALWYAGRRAEALSTLEELARLRPDLKWTRERIRYLRAATPSETQSSL